VNPGDLTTLANTKLWLLTTDYKNPNANIQASQDLLLKQLITRWSQAILADLERPWILPRTYTNEAYDGHDNSAQFLRNWPVVSISKVFINGQLIPPLPVLQTTVPGQIPPDYPMYGYGYRYEQDDGIPPGGPQAIELIGTRFYRGRQNIQVTYSAGYQVTEESQVIPNPEVAGQPAVLIVNQPFGIWGSDAGVVYAPGSGSGALTPVNTAPTAPGTYQIIQPDTSYSVGDGPLATATPGIYLFSNQDVGNTVLISYGYIPSALEQIAIELSLERFRYRDRIGEVSRTLAGQVTAKYNTSGVPEYARDTLQRFRSVLPL
jgi:hypothetical protein